MPEIKVKRGESFIGMIANFPILINGQKVGSIKNGDEAVFPIEGEEAVVRVGAAPMRTKPVIVKAGQTLLLETNVTNFAIFFGTLILALLFGGLVRAIILLIAMVLMFFLPFYSGRIEE
ncbi:hypothetical protein SGODD07_01202 [Streptococcus gordonii]|uniref:Uncharacterized protein n=1 Tax=Streptococcus gordonii TaxID=1302 RepID=A0A139N664_STRGN|nr:hypothetical protein SGODD07_01202 [Streptococcus gordonii]